jgi:predicted AAA+ superfamily ATPase
MMTVLASLTGQELIYDNLAKAVGVDVKTAQSWVSALVAGNIIHLLQPYNEESVTKRVIRRPKIYFSDTGLACYLARVGSRETLIHSYLKGPMVETYIINEIIKSYKNNRKDAEASFYYFRNTNQKEIDLIILSEGKLTLVECKAGEEFKKSDIASFDLLKGTRYQLAKGAIVCTTHAIYPLGDNAFALPVTAI